MNSTRYLGLIWFGDVHLLLQRARHDVGAAAVDVFVQAVCVVGGARDVHLGAAVGRRLRLRHRRANVALERTERTDEWKQMSERKNKWMIGNFNNV